MGGSQAPEAREHARSVPAEHRIFSLILALVASPEGLTKRDILGVVYGYSSRAKPTVSDRSLERKFERDKDQLRRLGIPLEARDSPGEPGNNHLTRYRIQKSGLQRAGHVRFTGPELSLLHLAARGWSEGSVTDESRQSLIKLAALGAGLDIEHIGIVPNLGITEAAAPALQRAIADNLVASFEYQIPERTSGLRRTVAPLQLHRAEGRWHLLAHDLDREKDRVFLLSRITSPVRSTAELQIPSIILDSAQSRIESMITELQGLIETHRALLFVRPGTSAAVRLSARAAQLTESDRVADYASSEPDAMEIGTLDFPELAIELAGYGDEVAVQGPAQLRDDVIARLEAVRNAHRNSGGSEEGSHA